MLALSAAPLVLPSLLIGMPAAQEFIMPKLIGYVGERYAFWDRWIGALERLDVPTLVAWGERDPVAVLAIAHALAKEIPGAELRTWPELGHWPQLEDPSRVATTIEAFWARPNVVRAE